MAGNGTFNINSPKKCVVEFQAFRDNRNDFIIKELVFYDLTTNVVNYFLFRPPFPFRILNSKSARTNRWLIRNLHHISWEEGFTQYKELKNIMYHYCQQYNEIYTTGEEKSSWIQRHCTSNVTSVILEKTYATELNGFCIGVKNSQHKTASCALSRAYRIGQLLSSGGGSAYIPQ